MRALVVYESFFGNTERVAQAIGAGLDDTMDIEVQEIKAMRPEQMGELSLLVVGSPTRAFRPSPAVSAFLRVLPKGSLRGVKAAAFDTRIATSDIKSAPLRFIMNLFGYAAKPIASKLAKKGAELIALPEGFLVGDKEGPLKDGELDRATAWAKQIAVKMTDR